MASVLLISYSGTWGGAERILLDLAGPLSDESILACPEGPLAERARSTGLRVMRLRRRSLLLRGSAAVQLRAAADMAGHAAEVRRLVADLDPDLVVAWGMRSALACLTGPALGVPVVFQHNDLLPGPPVALAVRSAARRAARVLALSEAIAEDLDPSGGLNGRLEVVHPGVEPARFAVLPGPVSPPEVLLLGALVRWKRPDLALEAVGRARRRLPDLRLRVVGSSFDEDGSGMLAALRSRAQAPDLAGAIDFVGAVTDVPSELARASCLLHCAPREPFGLVMVEALAAGRPAIAPAAAGPAEIVDSSCGRLYTPADADAAAAALVEVMEDAELRARLGAGGRARAAERFSLHQCQERWARAVRPLVRQRAQPELHPAQLTVVTVTHNSASELEKLLGSVRAHLPETRVVVVDSGSEDESLDVARSHSLTTAIDLGRNAGFAAGCNAGVASVTTPVTALLNPDVELIDDSLLRLAESALAPPARLLAPRVLYPDGTRQDTVHPLPTGPADLLRAVVPPAALPSPFAVPLAPWRARKARAVGWAVGCALLARTELLQALGPFDERIFLYGEDLDLGLRAAARGVETWFCPQARVVHHRAHTSMRAFAGEPFALLAQTRRAAIAECLGTGRAWIDDGAQAFTYLSRGAIKRALGRPALRERRQLQALARVPR